MENLQMKSETMNKHGLDEQDVMHNQLSQLWHKLERQQQEQQ